MPLRPGGQSAALLAGLRARPGRSGQAVVDGIQRGLRPAREPELAEDVADVRPRRSLGDDERGRDLLVAHALTDEPEDIALALRQRLDLGRGPALPEALGQQSGDGSVEVDLAGSGRT